MLLTRLCMAVCVTALASASRSDPASKRLPSGFQGMRGKKSIDYSGLEEPYVSTADLEEAQSYLGYPNIHDSSGYLFPQRDTNPWTNRFQTNNIYDPISRLASFKRAPMGFQGMRGKKEQMDFGEYEYNGHNFDLDDFKDKRGPMGFQGMRGKRQFEYPAYSYDDKRALGFQGMRGKKDNDINEQILNSGENEKKIDEGKDGDHSGVTNNPVSYSNEQTTENVNLGENENSENGIATSGGLKSRRSASMGFYGMRGKKLPSASSFFGMRGKKGPFDYGFRGKFVGVRGKKMYQDNLEDLQQLTDRLTWTADEYQKRKGPSGFMGMRGKKWANFDGELAVGDMQGHHDGIK